jgi:hypothetical protein
VIQRFGVDVIEVRAVVDASGLDDESTAHEPGKKRVAFVAAVCDPSERGVLSLDAQTRVPHDQHEEPRLALGEAVIDDGLDAFSGRQSNISSASPP